MLASEQTGEVFMPLVVFIPFLHKLNILCLLSLALGMAQVVSNVSSF